MSLTAVAWGVEFESEFDSHCFEEGWCLREDPLAAAAVGVPCIRRACCRQVQVQLLHSRARSACAAQALNPADLN